MLYLNSSRDYGADKDRVLGVDPAILAIASSAVVRIALQGGSRADILADFWDSPEVKAIGNSRQTDKALKFLIQEDIIRFNELCKVVPGDVLINTLDLDKVSPISPAARAPYTVSHDDMAAAAIVETVEVALDVL